MELSFLDGNPCKLLGEVILLPGKIIIIVNMYKNSLNLILQAGNDAIFALLSWTGS